MWHSYMVYKPVPTPTTMSIQDAKVALGKQWTKLQKLLAWDESKVTSKAEVTHRAILDRQDSSFCDINGFLSSHQELRIGEKVSKVQRTSGGCSVKDDSGNHAATHGAKCSITHDDAQKSWMVFQDHPAVPDKPVLP